MKDKTLSDFADRLGHQFETMDLLREALTHSSYNAVGQRDNQRMEFLGDRVLGLVLSEALIQKFPDDEEGKLAPRFNSLVRKETCADVAAEIGLGAALRLGRSEMLSGGRRKQALLGDAMEAVIAAVYQDAGFEAAQDMILRLWADRIHTVAVDAIDAKTALQEWAQGRSMAPPNYEVTARSGPDHAPVFTIEVRLESGESAKASASSKRAAQQKAAAELLEALQS